MSAILLGHGGMVGWLTGPGCSMSGWRLRGRPGWSCGSTEGRGEPAWSSWLGAEQADVGHTTLGICCGHVDDI